jgi:molybdenum cofactor guanylyltransferase
LTTVLAGIVLAGGASRRMGTDKAFVEVDGVAMVRRAADALIAAGARDVAVVGGDRSRVEALGLAWVADRFPGEGPLGGVLTGLDVVAAAASVAAAPASALVVACDMPWLDPHELARLAEACVGHDAAITITDRPEPLHACYATTARPALADAFAAGIRALHEAVQSLDVVWVPGQDRGRRSTRNVNEVSDLDRS